MNTGTERETETLQQKFDRHKAGALENALKLPELIRGITLDEVDDEDEWVLEDDIPMLALELARQLNVQLRTLRRLKVIISNE